MKAKYKIGDRLTRRGGRDFPVMEIVSITYTIIEPMYDLKPVKDIGIGFSASESAIDGMFVKIG